MSAFPEPKPVAVKLLWADSVTQQQSFKHIDFLDLVELAHEPRQQLQSKSENAVFLPTLAVAKTKEAVIEVDQQTALVLDIDSGHPTMPELVERLLEFECDYLIYSTWSYRPEAPRWRIVIPLAYPVPVAEWLGLQEYFCQLLSADPCCCRVQQVSFAPAYTPKGQFEFSAETELGGLEPRASKLLESVKLLQVKKAKHERQQFERLAEPHRKLPSGFEGAGLFAAIRSSHSLVGALKQAGFKEVRGKFLPPESTSGEPGVVVFEDEQAGFCHNSSCPLHNDGHRFDVVDVLLHYRYQGDMKAMLQTEGEQVSTSGISFSSNPKQEVEVQAPVADNDLDEPMSSLLPLGQGSQLFGLAESVASAAQFPINTAILVTLGVASAIVSARYCVLYQDGSRLASGLYVCAEQPPASAKSRVLNAVLDPIQVAVRALNQHWAKLAEAEVEDEQALRSLKMFLTNATPEAVEETMLRPNNGFFTLASAEQSLPQILLGCGGRDKPNDNDLVLKGFAGEWHSSARITRSGYDGIIHGAIVMLAQEGTTETVLGQSNGQGIAERFLMISEPSMVGKRDFRKQVPTRNAYLDRYGLASERILDGVKAALSSNLQELYSLDISPSGWNAIANYRQDLEPQLADGCRLSHNILRGAAGKVDMQIMKLAVVLHVMEQSMLGRSVGAEIDLKWVRVAIDLADQMLTNLVSLLKQKGEIGVLAERDAILNVMKPGIVKTERQLIQSRSKVVPFGKMSGSKSEHVRAALARCVANGDLLMALDAKNKPLYRLP